MLLAIDVGNTNTVFAVFDGASPRGQWRAATDAQRTADEHAVWFSQLMAREALTLDDIDNVVLSTVVPQCLSALNMLCRQYCDCIPLVVGEPGVELGITVHVAQPGEVGADRLVNAVGAQNRYDGPLIIIDFGTATTFDAINEDGSYEGGIIAPGINLSLESLHQAAAQLPRIAVSRPASVIAKSTVPAMQSGIYWGYIGLIEGIVQRMKEEYGSAMTVVATGGLADLFSDGTAAIDTTDADLTIRGLQEIFQRNRAGAS
ncbi:MAG: type III pantothenate kinase [Alphaproteobacteria bacterium]|jgi:type III pantothenate kinase|nr:type III pantothenate kinase [Alphaproteobacteria bacterium]MDP6591449.1 type III pantothenate kinase [Alphaproteobacteria bacterium]MDP6817307.1 type III pantothenate kinase [Alphaproteobacteria bacterium]|tara:strand:+ start:173 stop:952 length:780 start_codon:yes stop_codon:yes gene_type:complete